MFTEVARRIEREWTGEEKEHGIGQAISYGSQRAYPDGVIYIRNKKYNSWPKELQNKFYSVLVEVMNEMASTRANDPALEEANARVHAEVWSATVREPWGMRCRTEP